MRQGRQVRGLFSNPCFVLCSERVPTAAAGAAASDFVLRRADGVGLRHLRQAGRRSQADRVAQVSAELAAIIERPDAFGAGGVEARGFLARMWAARA